MARREEMSISKLYGGPKGEVDRFLKMYVCVPATIVADRYVTSTNMKVGAYTVANGGLPGDGLAHNVTLARAFVGAGDTPGTVLVSGIDIKNQPISETIIPGGDGVTVQGVKAFKQVTSVVGSGWVIGEGNDTIVVGFGELVGMPDVIPAATDVVLVSFDTALANAPTVVVGPAVSQCTVTNPAAGNGTKKLRVLYQI